MKKKLTINSIAKSTLFARKKQYTIMIIGIILAMVFSSSVLMFFSCMRSSADEMKKNMYGAQDGIYTGSNEELIKKAKENGLVNDYSLAHIIGFGFANEDERDRGMSIAYLDDKAKEMTYISFIEGNYPKNENEIAIEKASLDKLGVEAKIGDTIKLSVQVQDGENYLPQTVEKSYKLVGIAENKRSNISNIYQLSKEVLPTAFVSDNSRVELGGKEKTVSYLMYDEKKFYDKFTKFMLENDKSFNYDNYIAIKNRSFNSYQRINDVTGNMYFSALLASVLLIASCMGIINAFSSNLNERKKQIGMLRTVGATKRQIINIFGREAFFICLVSAPFSLVVSYFMVKGITSLMGESFIFIPNWRVLILCGIFSVACVMLVALVPLIKASKIAPIQSIRNIDFTRKMKNKKIKTQMEFKVSNLLAKRNISFNKGSNITVSVLLIITILFSCFGFSALKVISEYRYNNIYDYNVSAKKQSFYQYFNMLSKNEGFSEKDKQNILYNSNVEVVNGAKSANCLMMVDSFSDYMKTMLYGSNDVYNFFGIEKELNAQNIDEKLNNRFSESYLEIKEKYGYNNEFIPTKISAYDKNVLDKLNNYVVDGKINIDKINSGEEIILYAPENIAFNFESHNDGSSTWSTPTNDKIKNDVKYMKTAESDYKAGDTVDISILVGDEFIGDNHLPANCERTDKKVTIGAIVSDLPKDFNQEQPFSRTSPIYAITSINGMANFYKYAKYDILNVSLKGDCTEEINSEMETTLQEIADTVNGGNVHSNFSQAQSQKKQATTILISMISIIILFLSISASIINNSLTARIRESKREIGTLRAVGATQKEIFMSYVRQLLSTFGWSYLIGFSLFGAIYLIYYFVTKIQETTMDFSFSVWQTIIACAILFIVCGINLWFKIRKETKNSIIDNIREL